MSVGAVVAVFEVPFTGFEVPLEVAVLGLVTGLTYSLLGVGLVLVYKTSRVMNFAHGEMGALASAIIPVLVIDQGWSYSTATAVALITGAAAGAFTYLVVIRKLGGASRLLVLVATIGIAQLFFAVGALIPKEELGSARFPTPFRAAVTIGDLRLNEGPLLILITVPLITAGLVAFFRYTKIGLASRAAAENTDAARLTGIPVGRIALVVWVLTGLLAAVSAILIGPTLPIVTQVAFGPRLLLRALAASMAGGLTSLPRTFFAGIGLGLVESLVSWNYPTGGWVELTLFAIILGSLLLQRRLGAVARGGEGTSWSLTGTLRSLEPEVARLATVRRLRWAVLAALLAVAVLAPMTMTNAHRVLLSSIALFAVMGLSIVVLTGFAGQISLGHFAFVGLGAIVGGRMHQLGYPYWMAALYATAAGGVVALVIGLPALRIRGLFLAVTTLGFAVASHSWLYRQDWLVVVVGGQTSLELPRPEWAGIDFQSELAYYYVCLAVLVAVAAAVARLRNTGVGRAMMAVRDNEAAAATLSVSPRRAKLTAFVLSGMIAALGGFFYGGLVVIFADPATFAPELSLALVGIVILGGVTTVTGPIIGATFLLGLGYVLGPILPKLFGPTIILIISGLGLLGAVLQFPAGMAAVVFHARDRLVAKLTGEAGSAVRGSARSEGVARPSLPRRDENLAEDGEQEEPAPAIAAADVVVRFGGNLALAGTSIDARPGEIVGLVGPNGAGKTTLFDVLSGHLRPTEGRVELEGHDITELRPEQRARLGLGRTFQQARLFPEMQLSDAFKVAFERREPSEVVPSLFGLPPSRRSEAAKGLRAGELLELFGLEPYASVPVGELSTGTRRLAELGCMVGLGARVLLLDEPTAGIAQREVEAFRPVLREIRDHLGATVLIIEHDMPLILGLVDRLYVLAAGRVIAEGPPEAMRDDPRVIAAYLGTDERVIMRSGSMVGGGSQ